MNQGNRRRKEKKLANVSIRRENFIFLPSGISRRGSVSLRLKDDADNAIRTRTVTRHFSCIKRDRQRTKAGYQLGQPCIVLRNARFAFCNRAVSAVKCCARATISLSLSRADPFNRTHIHSTYFQLVTLSSCSYRTKENTANRSRREKDQPSTYFINSHVLSPFLNPSRRRLPVPFANYTRIHPRGKRGGGQRLSRILLQFIRHSVACKGEHKKQT